MYIDYRERERVLTGPPKGPLNHHVGAITRHTKRGNMVAHKNLHGFQGLSDVIRSGR